MYNIDTGKKLKNVVKEHQGHGIITIYMKYISALV